MMQAEIVLNVYGRIWIFDEQHGMIGQWRVKKLTSLMIMLA